jgi:GT2 family glycosyltransferase
MKTTKNPLVSVIALNYNRTVTTRDLLISLRKITYNPIEIIIVDNASMDKSYLQLKDEFPEITLISSPKNLGFAGGNNLGIKAAKGEYILLINNDAEVTPRFLEPLVSVFQKNPKAGMASPKIVYFQRGSHVQYAGSPGINPWTGRGRKHGHLKTDNGQFDYVQKTELVHGACMMIPRKVIDVVGMLDESYFIYYEEHDWAMRAKSKGYKMFYVGTSTIYHKESITMGKDSPFKTYYMTRNRLLFLRRNIPYPAFIISAIIYWFFAIPKKIITYLAQRNFKNLNALFRGIFWHLGFRSQFA